MTARVVGLLCALLALAAGAPALASDGTVGARLVVGFHEGIPAGESYQGAPVVRADPALRLVVVRAEDPGAFVARAALDPAVRYVEPDAPVTLLLSPADPLYQSGAQYGPIRIGAPAAWDVTRGAASVALCVVDSGVRLAHEDVAADRYLGGIDLVEDDADPQDGVGHGTFVTSLATGATDNGLGIAGLAGVGWRHARVADDEGASSVSLVASGLQWCAAAGSHVVSASLGTSADASAIRDAVAAVGAGGGVLVAATGNHGCIGAGCVLYPAAYPDVVAVGCSDAADARCALSNGGPEVDVIAPGHAVVAAWGAGDASYATQTGTSSAAPHVAGALALARSRFPTITAPQLRAKLAASALDLGAPGFDEATGHGLLRADALLANAAPGAPTIACAPEPGTVGRPVACALAAGDDASRVRYLVDWGDGASAATPLAASGAPFAATHAYGAPGVFTIAARALDEDGLLGAPTTRAHEVRVCDESRAGALLAGAAGARIAGVSAAREEGIAPGCGGLAYELAASGLAPELAVCWWAGEEERGCGGASGVVPEGADAAEVVLRVGARVAYELRVPPR